MWLCWRCAACASSSLHEGSSLSCGSTRLPRTRSRSTPWRLASTRCVARERHLLRSRITLHLSRVRPNLGYCISSLTTAPLPSLPTPNALQSSCNLTKQAHAVKSKKSLNIIHIGNICKFPHKRTHDSRTHCRLENMEKRLNANAHAPQSFHLHTLHTVRSRR